MLETDSTIKQTDSEDKERTGRVILVTGDRNWKDEILVKAALVKVRWESPQGQKDRLIHGDAKGADRIAAKIAPYLHFEVIAVSADWKRYGRAAGVLRNQEMIDRFKPDLVLAFHDDLEHSKGTADCVRRAEAAGIPVRRYSHV